MSQEMENLKNVMREMMAQGFAPKFDGSMDPVHLREIVQAAQERMPVASGVHFSSVSYGNVEGEKCSIEDPQTDYVILYIHGGGLICGNAFSSRGYAATLATETKRVVYTLSYRLAPEHDIKTIYTDAFSYYKDLAKELEKTPIFLIGESGGAYLCYATAELARDNKITPPAGIVPYSAPIDFYDRIDRDFDGNEDFTVNPHFMNCLTDLIDPKRLYEDDPYANPFLDDMKNMPPMFLAWDENESLSVDQDLVVEKVKKCGGDIVYHSYPHCFHAFATTGRGTPESSEILDQTIAFFETYK